MKQRKAPKGAKTMTPYATPEDELQALRDALEGQADTIARLRKELSEIKDYRRNSKLRIAWNTASPEKKRLIVCQAGWAGKHLMPTPTGERIAATDWQGLSVDVQDKLSKKI